MRRAVPALFLALAVWTAAGAATHLVDSRGNLLFVEALTAVAEDGGTLSAIRVRQSAPAGKTTEEFVPGTLDPAVDLSPQILFDTLSGRIVVIWVRQEGRRMWLAGTSRGEPGDWSQLVLMDTGGFEPSEPRADVDDASRLHVVFKIADAKTGTGLRHRAYDLLSFDPATAATDPFAVQETTKGRWPRQESPAASGGGTGGAAGSAASGSAEARPAEGATKTPAFSDYGVAGGCGVAVVWRVAGSQLEVASLTGSRWRRGDVGLGEGPDRPQAESLAAEIAKRFCRS